MALLDQGQSQSQVARKLGVTPAAVSQWAKWRRQGGDAALQAKPHPGPQPKLTAKQRTKLEKLLRQGPRKHGYTTELWTLTRVAQVVEKHFGVSYSCPGLWHVMRGLGWSAQKPERLARERDDQAVATWRKQDWPRLKKSAAKRSKHCVYR